MDTSQGVADTFCSASRSWGFSGSEKSIAERIKLLPSWIFQSNQASAHSTMWPLCIATQT